MVTRRKKPRSYIDTNVILDYVRNRDHDSVLLLETIKRKKIRCWTTYYTVLELMDREQEKRWIWKSQKGETLDDFLRHRYPRKLSEADLLEVYNEVEGKFLKPFVDTDIITLMVPTIESWDSILQILKKSNFSIGDAFQLDAAVGNISCGYTTRYQRLSELVNSPLLFRFQPWYIANIVESFDLH